MSFQSSPETIAPVVRFEEGSHTTDVDDMLEIGRRIRKGNPNANEWNWSVSERIREYSPSLIAVDGMDAFFVYESKDVDLQSKKAVWQLLPDRPSRLNGTDEISVLAGDITYGGNGKNKLDLTLSNLLRGALIYSGAYALGKKLDSTVSEIEHERYIKRVQELAGTNNTQAFIDTLEKRPVDRRSFFKLSALVGATIVNFAPQVNTFSPWTFPQPALRTAADFTHTIESIFPFTDPHTVINGRTALLIDKTYEALSRHDFASYFPTKVGSVVMGNAHTIGAREYLSNWESRADMVREMTGHIIDKALEDDHTFTNITPEDRVKAVKLMQAKTQLFRVTEPDDKRFAKDAMSEIERCVTLVHEYYSSSVMDAVEDLATPPKSSS